MDSMEIYVQEAGEFNAGLCVLLGLVFVIASVVEARRQTSGTSAWVVAGTNVAFVASGFVAIHAAWFTMGWRAQWLGELATAFLCTAGALLALFWVKLKLYRLAGMTFQSPRRMASLPLLLLGGVFAAFWVFVYLLGMAYSI